MAIKRWIQRYDNYCRALNQLIDAIKLMDTRELSRLEKQGLVQGFEFTHELAWKLLKDFFNDRGNNNIYGSKDATREAFQFKIIDNGDIWMNMIQSRKLSSHTYDESTLDKIIELIHDNYYDEFLKLKTSMTKFLDDDKDE